MTPRMDLAAVTSLPFYDPVASTTSRVLGFVGEQGVLTTDQSASLVEPVSTALVLLAIAVVTAVIFKALAERTVIPALCKSDITSVGSFELDRYTRGKRLGGGSYGIVYQASLDGDESSSVVIKETKTNARDENATEFALAELFMNQKLKLCGQSGCCASFVGYSTSAGVLSLAFKNEGELTLDDALKRGFPLNVEEFIGGGNGDDAKRSATLIRRISKQIFSNLAGIHSWSVVHRDVKGANLILSERDGRFKLIDLGAACDLATGTNYSADLQLFDPAYCPPEAPPIDRGGKGGIQLGTGGAFDVFSAGLLLVQMCFPNTRGEQGIKRFKVALAGCDYDLKAWRETLAGARDYDDGFALLDAHGGWSVLQGCLREDPRRRISASAAAASGFCRA